MSKVEWTPKPKVKEEAEAASSPYDPSLSAIRAAVYTLAMSGGDDAVKALIPALAETLVSLLVGISRGHEEIAFKGLDAITQDMKVNMHDHLNEYAMAKKEREACRNS